MASQVTRSETNRMSRGYPASPFRLFEDFFNDWAFRSMEGRHQETWTPPVDVLEKDGNILLMASLPGLTEKEIEIKAEGQVVTIKGERRSKESEGYAYRQQESHHGSFSRSFTLPDTADMEHISADYRNGILTITVPPKPEVKPRTIKVNS